MLGNVAALYDEAIAATGDKSVAQVLEAGRARLSEPLRIALAGRVSTGKSTLTNALLGLPVAPTAAGECTRVVSWFRYGEVDRADAVLVGGTREELALEGDRTLPATLGHPVEEVEAVEVWLYNEPLERHVIVDTPGLASLTAASAERTEELLALRSAEAAACADALIYLVNGELREDDAQVLAGFRSQSDGMRATALNALMVLNKADKLGDEDAVRRRTEAIQRRLGPAVAAVVPMVGLLAETLAVGRLTERRAAWLAALACMPEDELARELRSVRRFIASDAGGVNGEQRADLLRLLDVVGIKACVEQIRAGNTGAVRLSRELEHRSGLAHLQALIDARFMRRAGVLKAAAGLRGLHRVLSRADGGPALARRLRDASDELALLPEMHLVRVMDVVRDVMAGDVELPDVLAEDLRDLSGGDTMTDRLGLSPGEERRSAQVALQRAARWRTWGNDPGRRHAERRAAGTVAMSYAGLAAEAGARQ